MANNPIRMIQIRRIVQLFASGVSQREVARRTSVHRTIATAYFNKFAQYGLPFDDLLKLDDQTLSNIAYSGTVPVSDDPRLAVLDGLIPSYLTELSG